MSIPLQISQEQFDELLAASDRDKQARADEMPTEQDALKVLFRAYERLKELGWNDALYSPKDGSSFDSISVGSTGIHRCHYEGAWPDGRYWVEDGGDLWPAEPVLYRRTAEEIARWEALRLRFAAAGEA